MGTGETNSISVSSQAHPSKMLGCLRSKLPKQCFTWTWNIGTAVQALMSKTIATKVPGEPFDNVRFGSLFSCCRGRKPSASHGMPLAFR